LLCYIFTIWLFVPELAAALKTRALVQMKPEEITVSKEKKESFEGFAIQLLSEHLQKYKHNSF
jgi:hypothetical protein